MSYSGYNGLGCPGASGCGCSGLGAYFTQYPGQVMRGFGASGVSDFAASFNAETVWADVVAGGNGNNAAGMRATKAIQAGLNELGYGPLEMSGRLDGATQAAWKRFKADAGLPAGSGLIQHDGLVVMETLLKQGKAPGPSDPVSVSVVGGEVVRTDVVAAKKAGLSTGMMLLIGAVVVGGVVLYAKNKKKDDTRIRVSGSSTSITPVR